MQASSCNHYYMLTSTSKMAPYTMAMSWAPALSPATNSPPRWGRTPTATTPPRLASSWPPSRGLAAANWRTGGPPPPPPGPECIVGRVVRLPEKSEVPATSCAHQQLDLHGQPWNHPAVITGVSEGPLGEQLVTFRLCTSFGGQGLIAKEWYHHQYFVPADQTTLDSGSFGKAGKTFVNCSPGHEYTIEFKYLQLWTGDIQFSQKALESFNKNELRPRCDSACSSY
ncbi:hypothetical protein E8E11_004030 [Didymella keratinophila]|nr:hypothetical protein E8E11_004030 [Didymella keratinophila]